ncbi:CPBP family intramembrane glutamic endopeptidase [Staphylococcus caeli]|uniref:Metal-dependent membrane protease n=1 Tax=Staphylococcus caeli TaxID=2201815 RepID=A0A1D4JHL5_9STAP|nr:CPBP family intramembrane glutamic endopeptidase [Staphylococcus caeli]SCS42575.1 metal-dependent membrane protease [Staphylococcus caeli]SCS61136.1 metal-dependent membrane protease [Staphylococcus caeli]
MAFRNEHQYRWKDINGRDFFLPVIYFVSNLVLSILFMAIMFTIDEVQGQGSDSFNVVLSDVTTVTLEIVGFLTIFGFWMLFHSKNFKQKLYQGFHNIKRHWKLIGVTFIIMIVFNAIYPYLVDTFAPEQWKFEQTQNDKLIESMYQSPLAIALSFFTIVIIAPVTEEFLFRYLLIGELGKKFNFIVMSVVSVLVFASLHVTSAKSPLEIVMYIIIAVGIVYVYLKTQRSLATAIALHAMNNLFAYIMTIIT